MIFALTIMLCTAAGCAPVEPETPDEFIYKSITTCLDDARSALADNARFSETVRTVTCEVVK